MKLTFSAFLIATIAACGGSSSSGPAGDTTRDVTPPPEEETTTDGPGGEACAFQIDVQGGAMWAITSPSPTVTWDGLSWTFETAGLHVVPGYYAKEGNDPPPVDWWKEGPRAEAVSVLHESDTEIVVQAESRLVGVVYHMGELGHVDCVFQVWEEGADWKDGLAICNSLKPATSEPACAFTEAT